MSRKLPIRTYQRKKVPNRLVKIYDIIQTDLTSKDDNIPREQPGTDNIKGDKISEDSLDNDPFETTFDRIAKNAVVPPIPFNCTVDKSWCDSSFDTSNENKQENKSLFHISVGTSKINSNSNEKYDRSWERIPYEINIKEKKMYNKKIAYKTKCTKELITSNKENQVKVYKKKKNVSKAAKKQKTKSSNDKRLSDSACKSCNDTLCELHNVNADIIKEVKNKDNDKSIVILNRNNYKKKIDLLNSSRSKFKNPLKETTNILNNYKKKKTCFLKPANKIKQSSIKNNQNHSLSSESYVSSLTNDLKIKSCSVILTKSNVEKWKLMVNKSNNTMRESNRTLDNATNNTLIYKSCTNDLYSKDNLTCSTPINATKKRSSCFILCSPINTASLMNGTLHNDAMLYNRCTIDEMSCEKNTKALKSTLTDHVRISKNDNIDTQKLAISYSGIPENSSNFINNRERYNTVLMDDTIGTALRQEYNETHQETKKPNFLNISEEENRSCSLFTDSGSESYILTKDKNISHVMDKSLMELDVKKSNSSNKLESSALYTHNNDESMKLDISKQEESYKLITSKAESIKKCTGKGNENTPANRCNEMYICLNQSDVNKTNVLVNRLQNSKQITKRKRQDRKKKMDLSYIHENENEDETEGENDFARYPISEMSCRNLKVINDRSNQNLIKNLANTSMDTVMCYDEQKSWSNRDTSFIPEKFIYLKPGKCWTRSLSILHNFPNGLNLNEMSVKKGKKWRHSVQDILDMQKKDFSLNYREANKCIDKLQAYNDTQIKSCNELTETNNINQCSLLKRFTRRISVRVVRDNNCIQNTADSSFLEVFGISTNIKPDIDLTSTVLGTDHIIKNNTQYNDAESEYSQIYSSEIAKEVVLQRCSQKDYLPFKEYVSTTYMNHCRKIGEGVYGEVFLYEKEIERSVLKIIPIEGNQLVNGEPQKKFNEILSEIVIAKELHNLRYSETHKTSGFVEVKNIKCIKGQYPEEMINLWKIYDNEKTSDNDCPSILDENQLYIVFELGHGGQDLESFEFHTAFEAHTSFIQIALTLAVAEKSFKFEHRDLHWGNVLISHTDDQYICYKLDNKDIFVPTNGAKVCIIDFTLSRMSYQGCCIFNDLALDPALFTAQGEYQFEIYRLMREKIQNNWQEYEPYTNILWLHYILDKMIKMVRYKRKNLKKHKNAIIALQNLKQVILSYSSAFDFVTNCNQITSLIKNT